MNRLFVVVPWWLAIWVAPFWAFGWLAFMLGKALWQAGGTIVRDVRYREAAVKVPPRR